MPSSKRPLRLLEPTMQALPNVAILAVVGRSTFCQCHLLSFWGQTIFGQFAMCLALQNWCCQAKQLEQHDMELPLVNNTISFYSNILHTFDCPTQHQKAYTWSLVNIGGAKFILAHACSSIFPKVIARTKLFQHHHCC